MKLQMGPKTAYLEPITFYNNYALFVGNYNENNLPEYSSFNTPLASPRPQSPQAVKELSGSKTIVRSRNLLKISNTPTISNGLSSTVADDGTVTYSGQMVNSWADITKYIIFSSPLPAGTYTFSIDHPRTHRIIFKYRLADNTFNEQIANMTATSVSETFTVNQPIISGYLYIAAANGSNINDTVKAQLEAGSIATAYEPCQDQLFTIPNNLNPYKLTDNIYDEVKLENGVAKLIKRVGKIELSGEETNLFSYKNTVSGTIGFSYGAKNYIFKQSKLVPDIICSHFNPINEGDTWHGLLNSSGVSIFAGRDNFPLSINKIVFWFSITDMQNLKITDLTSFKNWLKAEKAKGTPVTIYYEMKTPTEEEITDQAVLNQLLKLRGIHHNDKTYNLAISGDIIPKVKLSYKRRIA